MIVGRRLELNTVAILIFLSLTTWMWGIVGTIIGVPLLVVIKVFSDNFPALSSLGEFLSAEPRTTEEPEVEHSAATLVIERASAIERAHVAEPIKGDTP